MRAEEFGYDLIGVGDSHPVYHEVYVSLAAAALNTSRALLATTVTNPVTRHPSVTASAIASVDELSGGRAVLGIGSGASALFNLQEHAAGAVVQGLRGHREPLYHGLAVARPVDIAGQLRDRGERDFFPGTSSPG